MRFALHHILYSPSPPPSSPNHPPPPPHPPLARLYPQSCFLLFLFPARTANVLASTIHYRTSFLYCSQRGAGGSGGGVGGEEPREGILLPPHLLPHHRIMFVPSAYSTTTQKKAHQKPKKNTKIKRRQPKTPYPARGLRGTIFFKTREDFRRDQPARRKKRQRVRQFPHSDVLSTASFSAFTPLFRYDSTALLLLFCRPFFFLFFYFFLQFRCGFP